MVVMLIGGAVVQTIVPSCGLLGGAKLPVLLAVVLYYALTRSIAATLAAAFLGGFLHDVLSRIPLGHSVFCFCIAGWMAGHFKNMVLSDSVITTVVFGGFTNSCVTLIFYLMLAQDGLVSYSPGWIALKMFGALLLGMVCTPAVFYVAGLLDKLVGNVEMEHDLNGVE